MAPDVSISVYRRPRRVIRRWKTRQCRSVQSIMGATEKRRSKSFIALVFYDSSRSYKGLDRLANVSRASAFTPVFLGSYPPPIGKQIVTPAFSVHTWCTRTHECT